MGNKRVAHITWLQAFGCMLVIFGHSYPITEATFIPSFLRIVQRFVYAFHMPLFVFCSGALLVISHSAERYSLLTYTKRRAKRLLLPYVVLSLLFLVPKILLSSYLNDQLSFDYMQIIRTVFVPRENVWGHFWFLPTIFLLGSFGFVLLRACRSFVAGKWIALAIGAAALIIPSASAWFALDDILNLLFYFVLGICCANPLQNMQKPPLICCLLLTITAPTAYYFFVYSTISPLVYEPIVALLAIGASVCVFKYVSERFTISEKSVLNRSFSIFILS